MDLIALYIILVGFSLIFLCNIDFPVQDFKTITIDKIILKEFKSKMFCKFLIYQSVKILNFFLESLFALKYSTHCIRLYIWEETAQKIELTNLDMMTSS